jgi:Mn2+/Fe2+ NRAMP family transporter
VEEEKTAGRRHLVDRLGASSRELRVRRLDVRVGTFFSNVVMFFIILTTGLTLHRAGITNPTTSREVASALAPLAGRFASWLYTIGLVGTGALAIPTLAGSASYAFADVFDWRQGMDERFRRARAFYGMFALSIALGMTMHFAHVNPVSALYWSAVVNGLLAPALLIVILFVASSRAIMNDQPSPLLVRAGVAATAVLMIGAAVMMFR